MAHISLRQLQAFVSVAETKNFNRAAESLHLSPSTVSSLIAELESRLEFNLFERTTRHVSLSSRGREFRPYAMSVLRQLKIAEGAAVELKRHSVRIVRVAAPQVVAASLLPKIIAGYIATRPDVRIHTVDSSVITLSDRIVAGDADIAIGPEQPVAKGLSATTLFESRWVLWCHPKHPAASMKKVQWAELAPYTICAAGPDHEQSLAAVIGKLPPKKRFQVSEIVDNVTTALGIVAANIAVTMTPEFVQNVAAHTHLVKRPLIQPSLTRRYVLYTQTDPWVPEAVKEFADYIQDFVSTRRIR
jgi:DNA-binding transcriptional LysR family regulator